MIGRQLGFSTFAFILTFVLNLAKVKYLSNVLSPDDFGMYTLFFNTVSFASLLLLLGLDRYLTTHVAAASEEEGSSLLSPVLVFFLFVCALAWPLLWLLPGDSFLKANVAVGTVLFGLGNILRFYLLARRQVNAYNVINLLLLHAWLLGLPLLGLSIGVSLGGIFALMNAGFLVSVLLAGWAVQQLGPRLLFRRPSMRGLIVGFQFALPMVPVVFATKFLQVGDRYFLVAYAGAGAVAMYSLVSSVIGMVVALLTVISDTLRPYILREGLSETGKLMMASGLGISMVVISGVVPGIYFFGEQALRLLANAAYTKAAYLFPWLLPVLLTQAFISMATFLLEKEHRTRTAGVAYLLAFAVFIGVNVSLGPSMKSLGCAIAYTASSLLLALVLIIASGLQTLLARLPWIRVLASTILLTAAASLLSHFIQGFMVAPVLYAIVAAGVMTVIGRPMIDRLRNRA